MANQYFVFLHLITASLGHFLVIWKLKCLVFTVLQMIDKKTAEQRICLIYTNGLDIQKVNTLDIKSTEYYFLLQSTFKQILKFIKKKMIKI